MKKEIIKNNYALCMPLTGKTMEALKEEISEGIGQDYDFFEWRRDYFEDDLKDEGVYLEEVRRLIKDKGLIYTFRSEREGGRPHFSDQMRLETIKAAINTGLIDYIDIELDNQAHFLGEIDKTIAVSRVKKILSYHHFTQTPPNQELFMRLDQMELNQADVFKLAVWVETKEDLRRLIRLSLGNGDNIRQPLILIAMGTLGKITRIAPELCGGSLSFAAGKKQTAPGQVTYEEIIGQRKALGL